MEASNNNLYHYKGCGLKNVYLRNGWEEKTTSRGSFVAIVDVEGLHKAIAECLVNSKPFLTGPEFRFLRKQLDMTQKSLGEIMGYDTQTIARWEKLGRVPKWGDRFVRKLHKGHTSNAKFMELIEGLNELDRRIEQPELAFVDTDEGWQPLQKCA